MKNIDDGLDYEMCISVTQKSINKIEEEKQKHQESEEFRFGLLLMIGFFALIILSGFVECIHF